MGVSQEEFAELAGLHRTYIGAIERGERNVSIDNIAKIAKALDLSITKLFENSDR
jgi:transcriptional regulator with XRE-family HTH domain